MEYILMFLSVIALTWLYEHSSHLYYEKIYHIILALLIIMLPSILSGMRNINVGTDTLTYKEIFTNARNSTLLYWLQANRLSSGENFETGFILYVWLISRITSTFGFFEFINTFLTFGIFFKGALYFKRKCDYSLTLMITIYLFVYYCAFLNYGRQGLAISLLWFSLRYMKEKKIKKFFVIVLLATSIHLSSITFLPLYLLFVKNRKMQTWKIGCLILIILSVVLAGPQLIYQLLFIFSKLGIRTNTVLKYARHFSWVSRYELHISQLLMSFPQLIVFSLFYQNISQESEYAKRYYILCFVHVALTIIGSIDANFNRLSFSVGICEIILFASLYKSFKQKTNVFIYEMCIGVYLIVYWCFFVVNNFYYFNKPVYPFLPFFK